VQMGASVVLIERHRMGGDCLNTGCVPSKALIAAAGVAQDDLARVEGPAGLALGAVGPAEIALSIAASMVKRFRDPR